MSLLTTKKIPTLSSNVKYCPIPLRYDTYTGCTFNCSYCFAEPIIDHIRKLNNKSDFKGLVGADPIYFDKWLTSTLISNKEFKAASRVAIKNKLPVKIGSMSDPFPYVEEQEKITYQILKSLHKFDYPVQISTKNPLLLSKYYPEFENPNWVIAISLCSVKASDISKIEPHAPSLESRIAGIKSLTSHNASVFLRMQPFIYPYALSFYKEYIDLAKSMGCKGIIVESLKMSMGLSEKYRNQYKNLNEVVGYDIIEWYKVNGQQKDMDYMLKLEDKLDYINKLKTYASQVRISILVGENETECRCQSCSGECCGTYLLKKHIIINNKNSSCFNADNVTNALDNCKISLRNKTATIKELINK